MGYIDTHQDDIARRGWTVAVANAEKTIYIDAKGYERITEKFLENGSSIAFVSMSEEPLLNDKRDEYRYKNGELHGRNRHWHFYVLEDEKPKRDTVYYWRGKVVSDMGFFIRNACEFLKFCGCGSEKSNPQFDVSVLKND